MQDLIDRKYKNNFFKDELKIAKEARDNVLDSVKFTNTLL
jgi:hypothetical protein